MIAQRIALASMTADELWQELNDFCAVEDDKETLAEDYEYGRSVVSALAPHRERFGPQVLSYLGDPIEIHGLARSLPGASGRRNEAGTSDSIIGGSI